MNLDALLYTDEAAELARVTPDRIRRWAKDYPTVMPAHRDERGRPKYRAADVLKVESATRSRRRLPKS